MNSLLDLRAAAASALPPRAFLKRDRGVALFITDAPRLCPDADWPGIMAATGFACAVENGLAYVSPNAGWLSRLESAYADPPDALCKSLARFRGLDPDAESLALFALGARILEGEPDDGRFQKLLRQRAAVCLRLNAREPNGLSRGGGLYACALLNHIIKEETT